MPQTNEMLSALIIGCGDIAGGYDEAQSRTSVLSHAGAYRADGRFTLLACVEPDADRRHAFERRWDVPASYADLDACLDEQTSIDVASVCSPSATHESILERLLDSPARIVFCEKPMTGDPVRSEQLGKSYAAAGKKICVNYLRRWDPAMAELRRELADGAWGEIRSVTGFYAKGLLHTGSHMLDLVQFLFGPLTARSALRRLHDFDADDATIDAVLSGPGDVPVYLIGSDSRDYARFEVEFACQHGVVRIEDSGFRIRRRRTEEHRLFPGRLHLAAGDVTETGLDTALAHAVNNIHDAAANGEALAADAQTAASVERLCREISDMAQRTHRS